MPQQLKEVEITPHHRPTEWVKAGFWAFVAIVGVIVVCGLFIQKPDSLGSFLNDISADFVVAVLIITVIVVVTSIVMYLNWKKQARVIDVGQFGTVVIQGKKTKELAPLMPDNLPDNRTEVNLVTPSTKAGDYLPYVKLAAYLQAKGVDLQELEDCIDEQDTEPVQEFEQPHMQLTELQKRVLNLWEQGHHGRLSIHKADTTISEHVASRTIAELKGAGLIK